MLNNNIQESLYELLETNELNEDFIKEEFQKQEISNEKLQKKIFKAVKKPFKTNSAMKKRINRIFKRHRRISIYLFFYVVVKYFFL